MTAIKEPILLEDKFRWELHPIYQDRFYVYDGDFWLGTIKRETEDSSWTASPSAYGKLTVRGFQHEFYAAEYLKLVAR